MTPPRRRSQAVLSPVVVGAFGGRRLPKKNHLLADIIYLMTVNNRCYKSSFETKYFVIRLKTFKIELMLI